jgi:DNA-directed RNA polymerase specialized sigma24 family protein
LGTEQIGRPPIPLSLRDPTGFEPWLHRILTNARYAEARRR